MNERFQELAEQAKFIAEETINKQISKNAELDAFAEKLVELVVRECIDVLVTEMNRLDGLDRVVSAQTMDTAQVLIKQHFGVEE